MEITCARCHQAILAEQCYCPFCGLPQLLYELDGVPGQPPPEHWNEAVPDAGAVSWKPALRAALLMAVPAGMLSSLVSPLGVLGFVLMSMAAAWAVVIYTRNQKPAWLTFGAGARVGLVAGLMGGWIATATTGVGLFSMRFFFHQGFYFDDFWKNFVSQQMQQWTTMGVDAQTIGNFQRWLLSPEGRAGSVLGAILFLVTGLIAFAAAGGAFGARMMARSRKPEV
jgi:hypothetical protein